jgi:hypothetical protein
VHGKVTLNLLVVSRIKVSIHHMMVMKLEEIHVVREFLFPNDMPGMPPKRAIKFKIKLQPGTPIAKSLYQMTPVELTELKIHLGVVQHYLCQRKINDFVYVWITDR